MRIDDNFITAEKKKTRSIVSSTPIRAVFARRLWLSMAIWPQASKLSCLYQLTNSPTHPTHILQSVCNSMKSHWINNCTNISQPEEAAWPSGENNIFWRVKNTTNKFVVVRHSWRSYRFAILVTFSTFSESNFGIRFSISCSRDRVMAKAAAVLFNIFGHFGWILRSVCRKALTAVAKRKQKPHKYINEYMQGRPVVA